MLEYKGLDLVGDMLSDLTPILVLFQLAHAVCNYNQLHKFNSFDQGLSSCRFFAELIYPPLFTMIPFSLETTATTHHSGPSTCRVRKNLTVHDPFLDAICRIGYCCSKYFKFVRLTRVHAHPIEYLLSFIVLKYIFFILIIIIKDTVGMHGDQK